MVTHDLDKLLNSARGLTNSSRVTVTVEIIDFYTKMCDTVKFLEEIEDLVLTRNKDGNFVINDRVMCSDLVSAVRDYKQPEPIQNEQDDSNHA